MNDRNMVMKMSWFIRFAANLPHGESLDLVTWERYHKRIVNLLWFHAAAIPCFGVFMGNTMVNSGRRVFCCLHLVGPRNRMHSTGEFKALSVRWAW